MCKEGKKMKGFGKVFRFELKNYLQNRLFVGITFFLVIAIAVVLCFPRFTEPSAEEAKVSGELPVMLVAADSEENAERIREAFSGYFTGYNVQKSDLAPDAIKETILSGEAACVFYLNGTDTCTYYVNNLSLNDTLSWQAAEILRKENRKLGMIESGVAPEQAEEIMTREVSVSTVQFGKDQTKTFYYTYIMIFALYIVIMLYGQMTATSVATEKSSRTMELLITSTDTDSLIFGKVLASCLAGFAQLSLIFGSAVFFYRMNAEYWADNSVISSIFNLPPELLVYMLVFFILGFLVYAFLYGSVGSTVSRAENVNTAVMPITLLFVISFLVVMISLVNDEVNGSLMRICSFIPFTSPVAMFTRIAMSEVPAGEIALCIGILAAFVILVGYVSARIYRNGVLMYGNDAGKNILGSFLRKRKTA